MSEDKLSNYEEVDLMDYLEVIWRWKYLILLGTFVCAIVAGVVSLSLPKLYETTEVVEIGKVRDNLLADVNAVESIMMSESFTNQVISKLNLDESPARLLKRIKVQKIGKTERGEKIVFCASFQSGRKKCLIRRLKGITC